jgi:hypothetical protein
VCSQDVGFFQTMRSPFEIVRVVGSQWGFSVHPTALNLEVSPREVGAISTTRSAAIEIAAVARRIVMSPLD